MAWCLVKHRDNFIISTTLSAYFPLVEILQHWGVRTIVTETGSHSTSIPFESRSGTHYPERFRGFTLPPHNSLSSCCMSSDGTYPQQLIPNQQISFPAPESCQIWQTLCLYSYFKGTKIQDEHKVTTTSPARPERLCVSPNLLSNGYQVLFSWG
jgi:hypothetical protein